MEMGLSSSFPFNIKLSILFTRVMISLEETKLAVGKLLDMLFQFLRDLDSRATLDRQFSIESLL